MSATEEPSAQELLAQAHRTFEELRAVADRALSAAKARLSGGRLLDRQETKALNRAAALARYVADCAQRSMWNPPKRRALGGPPTEAAQVAWQAQLGDQRRREHERAGAELLRSVQLDGGLNASWARAVRSWLDADARFAQPSSSARDGENENASPVQRS